MQRTAIECKTLGASGGIYSLSLLHVDEDGAYTQFSSWVNPGIPLSPKQETQLGVASETLANAPALPEIWQQIREHFLHSLVLYFGNDLAALTKGLEGYNLHVPTIFSLNLRDMGRGMRPDEFKDAKNCTLLKLCESFGAQPRKDEENSSVHLCEQVFRKMFPLCKDWETYIGMYKQAEPPAAAPAYTFIDCETADPQGTICAIAVLHQTSAGELEEYYTLVNPERPILPENTAIHHLTDEMVKNSPTFEQVWKEIRQYFSGSIIVAHSAASADLFFLRSSARRYRINLPEISYICTCNMARKILPKLENHKLDTLCRYFSIPLEHHNALSDTYGCYYLFQKLSGLAAGNIKQFISPYDFKQKDTAYTYRPRPSSARPQLPAELFTKVDAVDFTAAFVVTGDFKAVTREEAEDMIKLRGGSVKSSVTKAVKYVVVGSLGSERWVRGSYGQKIEKAKALGVPIISEENFLELAQGK